MSEAPDLSENEALAAEHALGVLNARDRADAEMRMAREPAFAADVEAWRMRLAPMLSGLAAVPAPQGLWQRIERLLPANDGGIASANDNGAIMNKLRFWRNSAVGGFALAAASLAGVMVQVNQPPVVVERQVPVAPQGQLLSASVTTGEGSRVQPLFTASYDPDRKALIVTSLLPEGSDRDKVHQLWLIAGKDNPKSLGLVESGKAKVIALPTELMAKMAEGATLAVSLEAPGGSKNPNGPTGPVIGAGQLSRL
ncbi:MAG: anti-sigma factor [Alphaproteobacteria bacterium]|nr:anti-sigma factor [Alphaproteobacteria bacterium]MBU1513489.1 anti-sigma factor [Alphaproteobacteria bacterium]MBU2096481.1 anti-sigma factor [Alphaproteobacteria bacterium]MBU2149827.1 anti-sigma factor [Alphaproteobacteria bacterium]MBU2305198.1 anti-sigma factor [Alphaproteobacteria bacterium]